MLSNKIPDKRKHPDTCLAPFWYHFSARDWVAWSLRHGGTRPRPRGGQPAEDKHLSLSSISKGSMDLGPPGSNAGGKRRWSTEAWSGQCTTRCGATRHRPQRYVCEVIVYWVTCQGNVPANSRDLGQDTPGRKRPVPQLGAVSFVSIWVYDTIPWDRYPPDLFLYTSHDSRHEERKCLNGIVHVLDFLRLLQYEVFRAAEDEHEKVAQETSVKKKRLQQRRTERKENSPECGKKKTARGHSWRGWSTSTEYLLHPAAGIQST